MGSSQTGQVLSVTFNAFSCHNKAAFNYWQVPVWVGKTSLIFCWTSWVVSESYTMWSLRLPRKMCPVLFFPLVVYWYAHRIRFQSLFMYLLENPAYDTEIRLLFQNQHGIFLHTEHGLWCHKALGLKPGTATFLLSCFGRDFFFFKKKTPKNLRFNLHMKAWTDT